MKINKCLHTSLWIRWCFLLPVILGGCQPRNEGIHAETHAAPQSVSDGEGNNPATSRTVYWWIYDSLDQSRIELRNKLSGTEFQRVDADKIVMHNDTTMFFWSIANIYGLSPDTEYEYRIGGEPNWTEWKSFRTYTLDLLSPSSKVPDRILLSISGNSLTTRAVTWRTDTTISASVAQIVDAYPDNISQLDKSLEIPAVSGRLQTDVISDNYHHVEFRDLKPGRKYLYRVGADSYWSEWIPFTMPAETKKEFSFMYLGDAQEGIKTLWARNIRQALSAHPECEFVVHAGDLVDNSYQDAKWGEWFYALSWLGASVPQVPVSGNHDHYWKTSEGKGPLNLSQYWRHLFRSPANGPHPQDGEVFFLDHRNVRLISINSTSFVYHEYFSDSTYYKEQLTWLDSVLESSDKRWNILAMHHPVWWHSPGERSFLADKLQPILNRHKVDLILGGHLHYYSRGSNPNIDGEEFLNPHNTVYVTSIGGPRIRNYRFGEDAWMVKTNNTHQMYQVIKVEGDTLHFGAYNTNSEVVDAFSIIKGRGPQPNIVNNQLTGGAVP